MTAPSSEARYNNLPKGVFGQMVTNLDCVSLIRCAQVCTSWQRTVSDAPAVLNHYLWLNNEMRSRLAHGADIRQLSGRAECRWQQMGIPPEWRNMTPGWVRGWRSRTLEQVAAYVTSGRWLAMRFALPTAEPKSLDWIPIIFDALERRAPEHHAKALVRHFNPSFKTRLTAAAANPIIQSGDRAHMKYCCDVLGMHHSTGLQSVVAAIKRHLDATIST
jgi:hypothetical protein